jgi:hypothetical protein
MEEGRMSLPYRQQRRLNRIDRVLCRSDPHLSAMLSNFARVAASESIPALEQLGPRRPWARHRLLWPVSMVAWLAIGAASASCGLRRAAAAGRRSPSLTRAWIIRRQRSPAQAPGPRSAHRDRPRSFPDK